MALEDEFRTAMMGVYEGARDHCGYRATRFLQMVRRRGGVHAAKKLLAGTGTSGGFAALRDHHRLDLSVEALVLRPEYAALFTQAEKAEARRRLQAVGYRVDDRR